MNSLAKVGLILGMMVVLAPMTVATHGDAIVYARDDGSVVAVGQYVSGAGNAQTWQFRVSSGGLPATCNGFGSIEVGFTGTGACANLASGTGHFHPYPNTDGPDVHNVLVRGTPGKSVSN